MSETTLTARQRQILDFIDTHSRERGYPPSVREIGTEVGLTSPSTVHSHLSTLQARGYLRRDPSKPRAIEVCLDPSTGAAVERGAVRHVPLAGAAAERVSDLIREVCDRKPAEKELLSAVDSIRADLRAAASPPPPPGRVPEPDIHRGERGVYGGEGRGRLERTPARAIPKQPRSNPVEIGRAHV